MGAGVGWERRGGGEGRGSGPHSADPGAPVADRLEDLPVPTRALPEGAEPVESAELVDDELDELLEEY